MGWVYMLRFPNGKCYVGQTRQRVNKRWAQHKRCSEKGGNCWKLCNAIRKYGWNSVVKQVLAECPNEELDAMEVMYIDLFDAFGDGYNLTAGGENAPILDPAIKERIMAKVRTPEARALVSKRTKALHADPEQHADWLVKNAEANKLSKAAKSIARRAEWADPVKAAKRQKSLQGQNQKEGFADRRMAGFKKRSAESEAKRKAAIKASWDRRKAAKLPGSQ